MGRIFCWGGEDIDEELEDSNDNDMAKDDQQEDGDDLVLFYTEGNTLTGCLILNWKKAASMLHFASQVTHIKPVVRDFVKNSTGITGMNAAEYLIKTRLIPKHLVRKERGEKEASVIDLFHQDFCKILSLLYV